MIDHVTAPSQAQIDRDHAAALAAKPEIDRYADSKAWAERAGRDLQSTLTSVGEVRRDDWLAHQKQVYDTQAEVAVAEATATRHRANADVAIDLAERKIAKGDDSPQISANEIDAETRRRHSEALWQARTAELEANLTALDERRGIFASIARGVTRALLHEARENFELFSRDK